MSDKRWKATERRIAALLGGRRVPVSGRGRGDAPDIAHPWLALEVKDRATLPAWLLDALDQAERSATPTEPRHEVRQAEHDERVIVPVPRAVQDGDGQLLGRGGPFGLVERVQQPGGQRRPVLDLQC